MSTASSPSSSRYDSLVKWGGAVTFMAVVGAAGWFIYDASKPVVDTTPTTLTAGTPTPAALTDAATEVQPSVSSAMPAKVTAPADLDAADKELDSSDLNTLTSDLDKNEADLGSF